MTPQITYRGMAHSPAMDARIAELAAKVEDIHPRITTCKVIVAEIDKHKQKGNLFEVHVDMHMPGAGEIVATHQRHEDCYIAVTAAFDVVLRQIENTLERHNHPRS
jgi:ribosome-associated translation inhibitor RaiA